jgi:hypothetical protein
MERHRVKTETDTATTTRAESLTDQTCGLLEGVSWGKHHFSVDNPGESVNVFPR